MKIKLRKLRLSKGLSKSQLARISKVHKSTISKIESGEITPTLKTLCRLCVALDVTLNDMVDCKGGFFDDEKE